jgi:photosystem II stability/assembly factor-like uncharacterized protein
VPSRLRPVALLIVLAAGPAVAYAHDPSAWGGLFRSRDHGGAWFAATEGRFVSGALSLAISPTDVNHLLLGTDSGLLRTLNGGRDWRTEAPGLLVGPVFAVAFDSDGLRALASTALGMFRTDDAIAWRQVPAPDGVVPARVILRPAGLGRAYLAGSSGLWATEDWGLTWSEVGTGLPEAPVLGLVSLPGPSPTVLLLCDGRLWASQDDGRTWVERGRGLPDGAVEAVATDPTRAERLWAAGADRVYRSDDAGRSWQPVGRPLPDSATSIRGLDAAGGGRDIVLTTHRGIYRSRDGGQAWELLIENLPGHLEAGPLLRDSLDPQTLYAGFSLTPYDELRRMATAGETPLGRLDALSIAGVVAFLVLLGTAGALGARWLSRQSRARSGLRSAHRPRLEGPVR